jgi:hypothetical protein
MIKHQVGDPLHPLRGLDQSFPNQRNAGEAIQNFGQEAHRFTS